MEFSATIPRTPIGISVGEEGGHLTLGGNVQLGEAGNVSSIGTGTVGESAFAGVGGIVYGDACDCH